MFSHFEKPGFLMTRFINVEHIFMTVNARSKIRLTIKITRVATLQPKFGVKDIFTTLLHLDVNKTRPKGGSYYVRVN